MFIKPSLKKTLKLIHKSRTRLVIYSSSSVSTSFALEFVIYLISDIRSHYVGTVPELHLQQSSNYGIRVQMLLPTRRRAEDHMTCLAVSVHGR